MSKKIDLNALANEGKAFAPTSNVGTPDFDRKVAMAKARKKDQIDEMPEHMEQRTNVTAHIVHRAKKGEAAQTRRMSFEITKDLYAKFEKYIAQQEKLGRKNIRSEEIRKALAMYLAGKVEKDNGGK